VNRVMQLFELAVDVRLDRGIADVGVDLHRGDFADRHRVKTLHQVIDVSGDDEPADRDFVANCLRRETLPLGDAAHLGSDGALTGVVHLGAAGHTDSLRRY